MSIDLKNIFSDWSTYPIARMSVRTRKMQKDKFDAQKMYRKGCQLFDAVLLNRIGVTRYMIKMGCPVDARHPSTGRSALHSAVSIGNVEQAKLLLEHGADVNLKDHLGHIPIDFIEWKNRVFNILQVFLNARQLLQVCDAYRGVHSREIFSRGSRRTLGLLLRYGVDFTAMDGRGRTPLHYLATNGNEGVMSLMRDTNFDPNVRNFDGASPLHYAVEIFNVKYAKILLEKGADPNCSNYDGCTPLFQTFYLGYIFSTGHIYMRSGKNRKDLIRLLLEHGANINEALPSGQTIIGYAISHYRKIELAREMIKPIVEHLAVIQVQGLPTQRCLADIRTDVYVSDYYDECKREIKQMRSLKAYGDVSFFNILVDSVNKVSNYVRNTSFVERFRKINIDLKFPLYAEPLKMQFEKATEIQQVKQSAAYALSDFLQLFDPNHIVIDRIISYLTIEDLRRLL